MKIAAKSVRKKKKFLHSSSPWLKTHSTTLFIALICILGVTFANIMIFASYRHIVLENAVSVSRLSAANIYSEINNELTKPIYVSLTMANDSFIKEWLDEEIVRDPDEIIGFLEGIQSKYDYSSTFLISTETLNYYRYTGFHKVISPVDTHDVWFYDFIASDAAYSIDVDVDEANGTLTIFVNAKIYDGTSCSGVVGVGVEMNYVQTLLSDYETTYGLEAFLINPLGLVQAHTFTAFIEERNIFVEENYAPYADVMIATEDYLVFHPNAEDIILSKSLEELDMFIVVLKPTAVFQGFIHEYLFMNTIMAAFVLSIVIFIVDRTVWRHKKNITKLASIDFLTNILNRRGFVSALENRKNEDVSMVAFMADINGFKRINDTFGHEIGDIILRRIADILSQTIVPPGFVARWGGDEFAGILFLNETDSRSALEALRTTIATDETLLTYQLSISVGYCITRSASDLNQILSRVDEAMFLAKKQDGIVRCEAMNAASTVSR